MKRIKIYLGIGGDAPRKKETDIDEKIITLEAFFDLIAELYSIRVALSPRNVLILDVDIDTYIQLDNLNDINYDRPIMMKFINLESTSDNIVNETIHIYPPKTDDPNTDSSGSPRGDEEIKLEKSLKKENPNLIRSLNELDLRMEMVKERVELSEKFLENFDNLFDDEVKEFINGITMEFNYRKIQEKQLIQENLNQQISILNDMKRYSDLFQNLKINITEFDEFVIKFNKFKFADNHLLMNYDPQYFYEIMATRISFTTPMLSFQSLSIPLKEINGVNFENRANGGICFAIGSKERDIKIKEIYIKTREAGHHWIQLYYQYGKHEVCPENKMRDWRSLGPKKLFEFTDSNGESTKVYSGSLELPSNSFITFIISNFGNPREGEIVMGSIDFDLWRDPKIFNSDNFVHLYEGISMSRHNEFYFFKSALRKKKFGKLVGKIVYE